VTLTRISLGNHVAVIVAILLAILFGAVSLAKLPIQLIPEIQEPQISIFTSWRAAAPNEVEVEIVEPQEDVMRGMPGVTKMVSQAREGEGEITLTFSVDMSLDRALIEVINRLNQVQNYPDDAEEPVISTTGADSRPIAWFIIKALPADDAEIAHYQDFVEEVVQTRFERVHGVARSEVYGGRKSEIRITFDPYKVASLGIGLPVVSRLSGVGNDVSGGGVEVGKKEFSLRYVGKYGVRELGDLIIEWRDGRPVYLRDVATVERTLVDRNSFVINKGQPALAVNAQRETGVNVLEVMKGVRRAADELREGPMQRAGLSLEHVYDETEYIEQSIRMLRNNLALGILLATAILWWFLRRMGATVIIALAVPICLLASFLVLFLGGRTLNIISLAGLAFAVGMVMDASIIVLENIVRLREAGVDSERASLDGTDQIWGALLASTATTVAIFLPIIFLKEEVGQIFGDLALTISGAICLSLLVAVSAVPAFAFRYLKSVQLSDPHAHWWRGITAGVMRLSDTPQRRAAWIAGLISGSVLVTWILLPKADYLPEGNRNLAFAFILPPPGANIDQIQYEMGDIIAQRLAPYLNGEAEPQLGNYFFIAYAKGAFMGVSAKDPRRINETVDVLNQTVQGFPDTISFAQRVSLFGGFGEGRTVDMDIQASDLAGAMEAAVAAFLRIPQVIPGSTVRPFPGLELAKPELRLVPDERRIAEAGWDRGIVAAIVRALGDGLYVGDYFDGDKTVDIIVRSQPWSSPEELAGIPLATPLAGTLPLSELVTIQQTAGPEEIRRMNRRRTVTLRVRPPDNISLEETIELLKADIEPEVRRRLPVDGEVAYTGTADKLRGALNSMQGSFLLAIAILYLLISALFRSFRDSLLVVLALPLATVGGVVMLRLINFVPGALFDRPVFQPMDMLTMIGFIILLGLVVNNAILLVHQARAAERAGLHRARAVEQAVSLRLRPILMSTLTSIFGMLPLLMVPGAGTELYRGLAGVIVGGLTVSMVFTLILLPSLLRIGEERQARTV